MRMPILIAVIIGVLALGGQASAQPEVSAGRWKGHFDSTGICLEVFTGRRLELNFQRPTDRDPVVVKGTYQVTATKFSDYQLDWHIRSIDQKQLTRCRKDWVQADLPSTRQMGANLTKRSTQQLTLHFECAEGLERVQFCLLPKGGKKVACANLVRSPRRRCTTSIIIR